MLLFCILSGAMFSQSFNLSADSIKQTLNKNISNPLFYQKLETSFDKIGEDYNSKNSIVCYAYILCNYRKEQYNKAIKALYYYDKIEKHLSKSLRKDLCMIQGDINKMNSNFIMSLQFFWKANKLSHQLQDQKGVMNSYQEIGVIYRDVGNYQKAEEYLNKAEEIQKLHSINLNNKFWLNIHFSKLNYLQGEYQKSRKFLNFSLNEKKTEYKNELNCYVYKEFANLFELLNQPDSVEYYLSKIINDYGDSMRFSFIGLDALNHMANLSIEKGDTSKAINEFWEVFQNAKKSGISSFAIESSVALRKYLNPKDFRYNEVSDYFIENYENMRVNHSEFEKYAIQIEDLLQAEEEILRNEEKLARRQFYFWVMTSAFLVFVILFSFAFYQMKKNKLQKLKLKLLNENLFNTNTKLDRFSSVVAHDIKTSVLGIKYNAQRLLEDKEITKTNSSELTEVLEECNKMNEFIEFLLVSAKTKNLSYIQHESINLKQLISEIEKNITKTHQNVDYEFDTQITHKALYGNYHEIKQLLNNLIENSFKYREPSRKLKIQVKIESNSNKTNLSVSDNGIGISKENQNKVFNLFAQGDSETFLHGVGLGLNICKNIAINNNGKIWLESQKNVGTTFFVELPNSSN
jgi:two-component system, sensor histidine kinase and response regulator